MLCKDCPKKDNDYPGCGMDYLGTCEICGNSVFSPCDTYYTNDHGVICHGGCK